VNNFNVAEIVVHASYKLQIARYATQSLDPMFDTVNGSPAAIKIAAPALTDIVVFPSDSSTSPPDKNKTMEPDSLLRSDVSPGAITIFSTANSWHLDGGGLN
jgi:hypothetical protein